MSRPPWNSGFSCFSLSKVRIIRWVRPTYGFNMLTLATEIYSRIRSPYPLNLSFLQVFFLSLSRELYIHTKQDNQKEACHFLTFETHFLYKSGWKSENCGSSQRAIPTCVYSVGGFLRSHWHSGLSSICKRHP